jgi:ribose/xylose/arabinose/galactoside ABC-type transport system permease subunit
VAAIVGSVATLAVGGLVALAMLVLSDRLSFNETTIAGILLLVPLVVPIALLVGWGELDLSFIGTISLAGYLYAVLTDDTSSIVALAIAALATTLVGLVVGAARFVLQAPSGLVSAGFGAALAAIVTRLAGFQGQGAEPSSELEVAVLAGLAAVGVTVVAVVLVLLVRSRGADVNRTVRELPGPEVVIGYGLSGLGAGLAGGLVAALTLFFVPEQGPSFLLFVLAAVAIAGVTRGSGIVAPLAGAAAAVIVGLIRSSVSPSNPNVGVALAVLLVVTLVIGYGINRLVPVRERRP